MSMKQEEIQFMDVKRPPNLLIFSIQKHLLQDHKTRFSFSFSSCIYDKFIYILFMKLDFSNVTVFVLDQVDLYGK